MCKNIEKNILNSFEKWVLIPLKEYIDECEVNNHFVAFIVLSVVIDNLSNMRYLGDIPDAEDDGNGGKRYRKFIKNYMPNKYKKYSWHLYNNFRCMIVHKFQLSYFDLQQSKESEKLHLQELDNGKVCLNSTRLYGDVCEAYEKLKEELIGKKKNLEAIKSFCKAGHKNFVHTEV